MVKFLTNRAFSRAYEIIYIGCLKACFIVQCKFFYNVKSAFYYVLFDSVNVRNENGPQVITPNQGIKLETSLFPSLLAVILI
jgi:hypothetical protein